MSLHPVPGGAAGLRRSRAPRRGLVALGLVVVVAGLASVGYLAAGWSAYDKLSVVQSHCGTNSARAAQTPADFAARSRDGRFVVDTTPYRFTDFRDVAFPSRDAALTIRGWFAPGPSGPKGPAVILVHGRGSCRQDSNVLLPAGMLHKAGFGVLLIDLRNHGDSDSDNGHWAGGAKEYRDVLGAWDWLRGQGYGVAHIGLFGASLGAATVTIATGMELGVAATWADSSYATLSTAAWEYAESEGYPGWVATAAIPLGRLLADPQLGSIDPADAVVRLAGRPFFIVHGMADATIPAHNAIDLAVAACGTPAASVDLPAGAACPGGTSIEPWLVPGAHHTEEMLLVPDRYRERLVAFFRAAIGATS